MKACSVSLAILNITEFVGIVHCFFCGGSVLSISSTTSGIAVCFRACGKNWLPATTFLLIRLGRQDWIPTKITKSSENGLLGAKCVTIKYFILLSRAFISRACVCVCVGGGGGEGGAVGGRGRIFYARTYNRTWLISPQLRKDNKTK